MPDNRLWRIKAALQIPLDVQFGDPQAIVTTRIPQRTIQVIDDVIVTYGPWFGEEIKLEGVRQPSEVAAITFTRSTDSADTSVKLSAELIESVTDDLSFQFQEDIPIVSLEVLDVTPPLSVGEERRMLLYPSPSGFPAPKFMSMAPLGSTTALMVPNLRNNYTIESDKTRAALRWYVKGLAATNSVDQFMNFWIAVEILCMQSKLVVKNPYKAPCGHLIPQCPTCNKSTEKMVNGDTIKQYMVGTLGIKAGDASDLWRVRQMFHGQNRLDEKATQNLPRMVYLVRYAAFRALKLALGQKLDDPPIFELGAMQVGSIFGLGGTRKLTNDDLMINEADCNAIQTQ